MSEIKNFDIKFQLTNEHLRSGGIEKIYSKMLLQEIEDVKYDSNSKPIQNSVGPLLRAFMLAILHKNTMELPSTQNEMLEYPSLLQKGFSFDQRTIKTEEEFEEIYKEFANEEDFLFRGVREASWRLYNSLQRNWILHKLYETEESYLDLLVNMIHNGKDQHGETIKSILESHNIDSLNDVATLGFLQHHSCPTPFLDWTYSFDNALYFAIDGLVHNNDVKEISDYFSVYLIEEIHFSKAGYKELLSETIDTISDQLVSNAIKLFAKNKEQIKQMTEKFKDRSFFDRDKLDGSGLVDYMTKIQTIIEFEITLISDKDKSSGLIFSLANSPNIVNQKGCFMWNSHPYKPLEVIGKENYLENNEDGNFDNYRFCRCLNIHKDLLPVVQEKLKAKGINQEYIYASKDIITWPIYEMSKKSSD